MQIKKVKKEKPTLINIKVDAESLDALWANARKYAGGNMSLWLRYAGLNCVPKRKDLA